MTQASPLVVQTPGVTYEAADFRNIFDQLFTEGVRDVAAGQLAVSALSDGTLRVAVAAGTAYVKGDDVPATQGLYILRCTAAENVTVTAPPSSGSRLDLLVYEEIDADVVALAGRPAGSRFRAIPGTAVASGSTPVLPTLPNTAIPLASFPVAAGQSTIPAASIVDMRSQAGAASIQVGTQAQPRTQAQRDAITAPFDGQLIYNLTTAALEGGDATSKLFGATTRPLGLFFGRGTDGDVTVTGTVTLTRDMEYRNLTVAAGGILNTAGFRVMVQGLLNNAGTIAADGNPGGDGSYSGTYTGAVVAAAGGTSPAGGQPGTVGGYFGYNANEGSTDPGQPGSQTALSNSLGALGGRGAAVSGAAQASMGTLTGVSENPPLLSPLGPFRRLLSNVAVVGGMGGTGGAQRTDKNSGSPYPSGSNTSRSGGGGGGGGVLLIIAGVLVNTGTLSARGGRGGNAGDYAAPGGGGGGGLILTFARAMRSTGTQLVTAGATGATSNLSPTTAATVGNAGTILNYGV